MPRNEPGAEICTASFRSLFFYASLWALWNFRPGCELGTAIQKHVFSAINPEARSYATKIGVGGACIRDSPLRLRRPPCFRFPYVRSVLFSTDIPKARISLGRSSEHQLKVREKMSLVWITRTGTYGELKGEDRVRTKAGKASRRNAWEKVSRMDHARTQPPRTAGKASRMRGKMSPG